MSDNQSTTAALTRLASRLQGNQGYMAYVLAVYQKQENLSDAELAEQLGTLPALVVRLKLCRRPAPASLQFSEQVRELADYTLTDETQLAGIIRQVDGLEKLSQMPTALTESGTETQNAFSPSSLLAAARDRDEMPEEELNSEERTDPEE
ncbi:MAG TPA: hypothetical protein VGB17_13950 [Pyrinomonadaceae bacterium]